MIFSLNSALIGPAAERPAVNDPTVPRNGSTPPTYICIDTLDVFQDTGTEWLLVGTLGSLLPGVTSDELDPAGMTIEGKLDVGGNVVAVGSLTGDNATFTTQPGGGLAVTKTDDTFLGLTVSCVNGSSGSEIGLTLVDDLGVSRLVWAVNADGSMKSQQGIGTHGLDPQSAPRTLTQAAITAMTDANAKTAVQAIANALADIGALTLT